MYVYGADTYCDSCGAEIAKCLDAEGHGPPDVDDVYSFDSDVYPKFATEDATDSPDHCASDDECLEAISLSDYGLSLFPVLLGAETVKVGAILSDGLTNEGVDNLREMLGQWRDATYYQKALHTLWREAFADDLGIDDGALRCPECLSDNVTRPHGHHLAKCDDCGMAFDTMDDDDEQATWENGDRVTGDD